MLDNCPARISCLTRFFLLIHHLWFVRHRTPLQLHRREFIGNPTMLHSNLLPLAHRTCLFRHSCISGLARFFSLIHRSVHGLSCIGLPFNFTHEGSLATPPCFTPIYSPLLITTYLFGHSHLIDVFHLFISPLSLRTQPSMACPTSPHSTIFGS
jgi:hypothetical protein